MPAHWILWTTLALIPQQGTDPEPDSSSPLDVVVVEASPFALRGADGSWSGLAVELWQRIAEREGIAYRYRPASLSDALADLRNDRVDVVVTALSISASREEIFDFTHPYAESGLAIVVDPDEMGFLATLRFLLIDRALLWLIILLILLSLLPGIVVAILESPSNPSEFGGTFREQLGKGLWWSIVTMTAVGYGDKAPRTPAGRAVASVWMYLGILMISGMTAYAASEAAIDRTSLSVRGPEDLQVTRVGCLKDSTAQEFLEQRRIARQTYDTFPEMLEQLGQERLDAIVGDETVLRSTIRDESAVDYRILPEILQPEAYALAIPEGREALRERLNTALLEVLGSEEWIEIRQRDLGF